MQKFSDTIATTKADGTIEVLPSATVTVYLAGTTTPATIFSTNAGAAKANPFLSDTSTGRIEFYAADGRYDLRVDKAGFATVSVSDILLEDPDNIDDNLDGVTISNSTLSSCIILNPTLDNIDSLSFSSTPDALTPRRMAWNNDEATADLSLLDGTVLQVGQELHYRARNTTASTIANGAVVWATGTTGNSGRINIGLAVANNSQPGKTVMGLLTHDTAAGADGYVTAFGKVRGVNTTGAAVGETWADGDILYLHPTIPGALTKVKPTVNGHSVVTVALVIHAHSNGTLFVRPTADSQEADEIRYTPAGTGAVATTVQGKLREVPSLGGFIPAGVNTASTDCATYLQAASNSGQPEIRVDGGTFYINSAVTINTAGFRLAGGTGQIKIGPNGYIVVAADDVTFDGVSFVGGLSRQQYKRVYEGVTSYFASPTYEDDTTTISGTDFTHTLSGNLLTVGTASLNTLATRYVVSSAIALDPAKKYVLDWDGNLLVSGLSAAQPVVEMFNGAGASLGFWKGSSSSTQTPYLTGASSIKIKLGVQRHYHTATNLNSVFQLTQIDVYELVNDAAALVYNATPWDGFSIKVNSGVKRAAIERCSFSLLERACVSLQGSKAARIAYNSFDACIQGIAINGAETTDVTGNTFDMRFADDTGEVLNNKFTRTRAIAGSASALRTNIHGNSIIGSNWAIEMTPTCSFSVIHGNTIKAENCGISIDGGSLKISDNEVTVAAQGIYGIEVPACSYSKISGNKITIEGRIEGFGVSASNTGIGVLIDKNTIDAPIGVFVAQSAATNVKARVVENAISYSQLGVFAQAAGVVTSDNDISLAEKGSGNWANIPPAGVYADKSTTVLQAVRRNNVDASTTYGINANGPTALQISDNEIITTYASTFVFQITANAAQLSHSLYRNSINGVNPTISAINYTGAIALGSSILYAGNTINGSTAVAVPTGLSVKTLHSNPGDVLRFTGTTASSTSHSVTAQLPSAGSWLVEVADHTGGDLNHGELGLYLVRFYDSAAPDLNTCQLLGTKSNYGYTQSTNQAVTVDASGLLTATWTIGSANTCNYVIQATCLGRI